MGALGALPPGALYSAVWITGGFACRGPWRRGRGHAAVAKRVQVVRQAASATSAQARMKARPPMGVMAPSQRTPLPASR